MNTPAQKFRNILTEDTILIPLSLCILLGGGVIWMTNLAFQVDANSQSFTTLEKDQKIRDAELNIKFERIMSELGFIRGHMEGGQNAKGGSKHDVQD